MSHKVLETKKMAWHHVNQVDDKHLAFLQETFQFHHLDYEDIQSETPVSKLDLYKYYLFMTLHIPRMNEQGQIIGIPFHIFLDESHIVTVTTTQIYSVEQFFLSCEKNGRIRLRNMQKGPVFFLYRLLMVLFKDALPLNTELVHKTNQMEALVYESQKSQTTIDLGRLRRNILFLRHLIDPQRRILISLSHLDRPFFPMEYDIYFDDIKDLLETVWLTTNNLKFLTDGLFEVNEALISHRTNEIIRLFTLVSIAFTGPIAVVGFYGMNVGWLPFAQSSFVVSLLFIGSFLAVLSFISAILRIHERRKQYED
ncbi:hypothetical protein CO172_00880 [Candidatus Uhrbacteria bacterium CG_4_9_14_3_um_filter_36_7]|uniref:Magnesium transporter CorA n=1 Tax=Candidatus Uhrbacteria bacterium CG_4_9_14_3_um_filter_36_7 TaxID=1975033 RepID=A0A2M7XI22_9BACT|nr:MAG: hypothetical protein CO172_00880 [Candidatus Uhrbacteria bacterium CG_4_9_14_3_um_filter_36_7]